MEDTYERLCKIAKGAAMMTETEVEIEYLGGCYNFLNNSTLAKLALDCLREAPREPWSEEDLKFGDAINRAMPATYEKALTSFGLPDGTVFLDEVQEPKPTSGGGGSSDVGDVQHICPCTTFTTTCMAIGCTGHSWQTAACAGAEIGVKGTIYAAKTMALIGLKVLTDPKIREDAKAEFDKAMAGKKYKCPITSDMLVP